MRYVLDNSWPEMQSHQARAVIERCMVIKLQHYTWRDFSGVDTEPPADWLRESQMGMEEINAWEYREQIRRAKQRARH